MVLQAAGVRFQQGFAGEEVADLAPAAKESFLILT